MKPIDPTLALVQATLTDLRQLDRHRRELTVEVARTAGMDPLRRQMFDEMLTTTATVARRLANRMTKETTR